MERNGILVNPDGQQLSGRGRKIQCPANVERADKYQVDILLEAAGGVGRQLKPAVVGGVEVELTLAEGLAWLAVEEERGNTCQAPGSGGDRENRQKG